MASSDCATFRVEFFHIKRKPNRGEILRFLTEQLKLNPEKLEEVQLLHTASIAVIQMKKAEDAREVVEMFNSKLSMTREGVIYNIPLRMDNNTKVVKILDCSSNISNEELKMELSKYGKIQEIKDLFWESPSPFAGIKDGNRAATMLIETPIPSFISIKGERVKITNRGQLATCAFCDQAKHYGVSCTQNRKSKYKKTSVNNRFLEVTQSGILTAQEQKPKYTKESDDSVQLVARQSNTIDTHTTKNNNTMELKNLSPIFQGMEYDKSSELRPTDKRSRSDEITSPDTEDTENTMTKIKKTSEGVIYNIPLQMDNNTKVVKILDCSSNISNEELKMELSKYGKIQDIRDLFWESPSPFAGIKDGNRAATMLIETPIPPFISIKGERVKITHPEQLATSAVGDTTDTENTEYTETKTKKVKKVKHKKKSC